MIFEKLCQHGDLNAQFEFDIADSFFAVADFCADVWYNGGKFIFT